MAQKFSQGVISIQADMSECIEFLDTLNANRKTVSKRILSAFGTGGRIAIRRNYRSVLNKGTGQLYRSIKSYVYRNGSRVVFTNDATSGKNTSKDGRQARYGFMLASGYTIKSKDDRKPMTFQIKGRWVRMYSMRVEPKDWVEAPIERYANSRDAEQRIDKAFQKQVDYWEKRAEGKIGGGR